jgi:hypothetical protein
LFGRYNWGKQNETTGFYSDACVWKGLKLRHKGITYDLPHETIENVSETLRYENVNTNEQGTHDIFYACVVSEGEDKTAHIIYRTAQWRGFCGYPQGYEICYSGYLISYKLKRVTTNNVTTDIAEKYQSTRLITNTISFEPRSNFTDAIIHSSGAYAIIVSARMIGTSKIIVIDTTNYQLAELASYYAAHPDLNGVRNSIYGFRINEKADYIQAIKGTLTERNNEISCIALTGVVVNNNGLSPNYSITHSLVKITQYLCLIGETVFNASRDFYKLEPIYSSSLAYQKYIGYTAKVNLTNATKVNGTVSYSIFGHIRNYIKNDVEPIFQLNGVTLAEKPSYLINYESIAEYPIDSNSDPLFQTVDVVDGAVIDTFEHTFKNYQIICKTVSIYGQETTYIERFNDYSIAAPDSNYSHIERDDFYAGCWKINESQWLEFRNSQYKIVTTPSTDYSIYV